MGESVRVSIREAAERLGLSMDQVRRRLRSGALTGQRDNAGQWWLTLPADAAPPPGHQPSATLAAPPPAPEDRQGVIDALRAHVASLEAVAADLRQERDDARARLEVTEADLRKALERAARAEGLAEGLTTRRGWLAELLQRVRG